MIGQKTSKSAKIFPLEKFKLYGKLIHYSINLSATKKFYHSIRFIRLITRFVIMDSEDSERKIRIAKLDIKVTSIIVL